MLAKTPGASAINILTVPGRKKRNVTDLRLPEQLPALVSTLIASQESRRK
jgi:hypothetical protein